MRILCRTHLLSLALLIAFANTSWATNNEINENVLRDILQNNQQWKTPTFSFSKPVDHRLSNVIAENVLHFGHSMGLELASLDPHATKSEMFSPLSLMAALSLLTLGAKSRTYQELKQLLGLDSDSELIQNPKKYHEELGLMLNDMQHKNMDNDGVNKRPNAKWRYTTLKQAPVRPSRIKGPIDHIIKVANGLFVQTNYSLNPDYIKVLQSIYDTELTQLDFLQRNAEARDYINAWVNKATFGKIPKIIMDDIDKSTNVIMASALYFKAFWETPFFFEATTIDDFFPDGEHNPPIKVQMMPTGGVFPFYDAKDYDCCIIGLPYRGNETTMYVIQPYNSTRQKLRDLQRVLDAHKINNMIDHMERKTTVLVFPKMRFTRSMHMKKILQNMNVHDLFVNGYSDLSLISQIPEQNVKDSTVSQEQLQEQFAPVTTTTESAPISFEAISRKKPVYENPRFTDKYGDPAYIFSSRLGEIGSLPNQTHSFENYSTTEESVTVNNIQTNEREKRQVTHMPENAASLALSNLESFRQNLGSFKSDLYVDDIIHNVDFSVDEQGTEAAAATLTYLDRSGTDVVFRGDTPFLIIIRHDPTKLPLFYGIINKP